MDDRMFVEKMELIVTALQERGCDVYAQLYGYITEKEPAYITRHKDARDLIRALDFERVKQYVEKMKEQNDR